MDKDITRISMIKLIQAECRFPCFAFYISFLILLLARGCKLLPVAELKWHLTMESFFLFLDILSLVYKHAQKEKHK